MKSKSKQTQNNHMTNCNKVSKLNSKEKDSCIKKRLKKGSNHKGRQKIQPRWKSNRFIMKHRKKLVWRVPIKSKKQGKKDKLKDKTP